MSHHKITNTPMPSPKWFWHCDQCAWVSVPKNANMQMRKISQAIGMHRTKFKNQHSTETVCILRNPRTRLISALGEFRKRKRRTETLDELLHLLLADASMFDEHLEPQAYYVQGISFTHILKFENLDTELMRVNWFRQHPDVVQNHIDPDRLKNSKHHRSDLDDLLNKHHQLVDSIIERYYLRDYELWNNYINYQNQKL